MKENTIIKSNLTVNAVKLNPAAIFPEYQTEGSAGADLHACIESPITLKPMQRMMVPTGLSVEVPQGHELQIRARSGLSIKHGILIVNGVGTIDSDFRGEIQVLLINLGDKDFIIEPDMRIAQCIVARYERVSWKECNELSQAEEAHIGFGSTGL